MNPGGLGDITGLQSESAAFRVQAESYRSDFVFLDPKLYFFKRTQQADRPREVIDTFSEFWGLAIGNMEPGQVEVYDGNQFIPIVGQRAVWIPPFTVVRWRLAQVNMTWFSYMSSTPPPVMFPNRPCVFDLNVESLPISIEELSQLCSAVFAEGAKRVTWLAPTHRNPLAIKLKNLIDREFRIEVAMTVYASQLRCAHETMTRAFRSEYGLPPLQYRNRLRLFQAMVEILMNDRNVGQASQGVGFCDMSHFNEQFKKIMRVPPSRFKPSRPFVRRRR